MTSVTSLGRPKAIALQPHFAVARLDQGRFTRRSGPVGAVAQDGDRRRGGRSQPTQDTAQLFPLPISLCGHADEHDPFAFVVADLDQRAIARPAWRATQC